MTASKNIKDRFSASPWLNILVESIKQNLAKAAFHKSKAEEYIDRAARDAEWLQDNPEEFVQHYSASGYGTDTVDGITVTKDGKSTATVRLSGHAPVTMAKQLAALAEVLAAEMPGDAEELVGWKSIEAIKKKMLIRREHHVVSAISKLRKEFEAVGVPETIIETKKEDGKTVYRLRLKRSVTSSFASVGQAA